MWSFFAAIVLAVAFGYVIYAYVAGPQSQRGAAIDIPSIGGPFELIDHDGRGVTEEDFRGNLLLVYFGYTYCPDVCPTSLTTLADAVDMLGADGEEVLPLFVSVDPERDTPEHLKMYVGYFHERMVGLTGTLSQVAAAAKAFRVYYAKVHEEGADPDDYLMDHTSIVYLMGRDGRFLAHFTHETSAEAMAARIREYL